MCKCFRTTKAKLLNSPIFLLLSSSPMFSHHSPISPAPPPKTPECGVVSSSVAFVNAGKGDQSTNRAFQSLSSDHSSSLRPKPGRLMLPNTYHLNQNVLLTPLISKNKYVKILKFFPFFCIIFSPPPHPHPQ